MDDSDLDMGGRIKKDHPQRESEQFLSDDLLKEAVSAIQFGTNCLSFCCLFCFVHYVE